MRSSGLALLLLLTQCGRVSSLAGPSTPSSSDVATFTMWRIDPPTKLFERPLDQDHIGGFIGDGSFVVVTDQGRTRVLDAETGREAFALSARGSLLASTRRDMTVIAERPPLRGAETIAFAFDLASGERRRLATLDENATPTLDPSGRKLAIATRGRVCVLDVDDGHEVLDVAIETSSAAAWSADGQALVAHTEAGLASLSLADESVTDVSVGFGTR